MSRTLSLTALAAMLAQNTGEVMLSLIVLDHADFTNPVRIVNDRQDIVSNGETYSAYPFEVLLPAEDSEQPQVLTQVKLCNVDRQVIALLRELATYPTVTLSLILASTPDTVEYGPAVFEMDSYEYDAQTITCNVTYENVLNEPIPADKFNPADYSGIFS